MRNNVLMRFCRHRITLFTTLLILVFATQTSRADVSVTISPTSGPTMTNKIIQVYAGVGDTVTIGLSVSPGDTPPASQEAVASGNYDVTDVYSWSITGTGGSLAPTDQPNTTFTATRASTGTQSYTVTAQITYTDGAGVVVGTPSDTITINVTWFRVKFMRNGHEISGIQVIKSVPPSASNTSYVDAVFEPSEMTASVVLSPSDTNLHIVSGTVPGTIALQELADHGTITAKYTPTGGTAETVGSLNVQTTTHKIELCTMNYANPSGFTFINDKGYNLRFLVDPFPNSYDYYNEVDIDQSQANTKSQHKNSEGDTGNSRYVFDATTAAAGHNQIYAVATPSNDSGFNDTDSSNFDTSPEVVSIVPGSSTPQVLTGSDYTTYLPRVVPTMVNPFTVGPISLSVSGTWDYTYTAVDEKTVTPQTADHAGTVTFKFKSFEVGVPLPSGDTPSDTVVTKVGSAGAWKHGISATTTINQSFPLPMNQFAPNGMVVKVAAPYIYTTADKYPNITVKYWKDNGQGFAVGALKTITCTGYANVTLGLACPLVNPLPGEIP